MALKFKIKGMDEGTKLDDSAETYRDVRVNDDGSKYVTVLDEEGNVKSLKYVPPSSNPDPTTYQGYTIGSGSSDRYRHFKTTSPDGMRPAFSGSARPTFDPMSQTIISDEDVEQALRDTEEDLARAKTLKEAREYVEAYATRRAEISDYIDSITVPTTRPPEMHSQPPVNKELFYEYSNVELVKRIVENQDMFALVKYIYTFCNTTYSNIARAYISHAHLQEEDLDSDHEAYINKQFSSIRSHISKSITDYRKKIGLEALEPSTLEKVRELITTFRERVENYKMYNSALEMLSSVVNYFRINSFYDVQMLLSYFSQKENILIDPDFYKLSPDNMLYTSTSRITIEERGIVTTALFLTLGGVLFLHNREYEIAAAPPLSEAYLDRVTRSLISKKTVGSDFITINGVAYSKKQFEFLTESPLEEFLFNLKLYSSSDAVEQS